MVSLDRDDMQVVSDKLNELSSRLSSAKYQLFSRENIDQFKCDMNTIETLVKDIKDISNK